MIWLRNKLVRFLLWVVQGILWLAVLVAVDEEDDGEF